MMTSKDIRKNFLDFFASKGHAIVSSAPMVVKDDPTLMFTNAGMNQFKDWFLGNEPAKYPRVADTQKCLRVSGKHNDLEEVGHDSYHHTMFEMLGNWSFGDYFKNEAIDWAWELLTEVYKLDKERLYTTIFEGSKEDGISQDTEAKERWLKYLPEERILNGNKKDNFWEMGDTGPCGPCSEIHVDLRDDSERAEIPGRELVNKGHHLVVEIWNLVFIQYNRKADGTLVPLPQKHVDTGMGLERLCMAMQGKKSNYDTDVFTGMISEIARLSGKEYGKDKEVDISMRVIADHIRAISFSIADGQLPSNVKAGYVIRRILRRAVRYAYTFLGVDQPFLCRLVPVLASEMGDAFPELVRTQDLITKVIKEEEDSFLRTLDKGIRMLDNIMTKNETLKTISGEEAFVLYDTYGFPSDLSDLIAREKGFKIDMDSFEKELKKQKERSRNATSTQEGDWSELREFSGTEFTGYESTESQSRIARFRSVKTKNKELFQIVLDKTPFYAESGGQVGDTGVLISENGERVEIINTLKENNLHIHITEKMPLDPSALFTAIVDKAKRLATANNHSATHLLHKALRDILGNHIEQKGSLVSSSYFRFDFSHYERVSPEKLREIEERVNSMIRENTQRDEYRGIPVEEAKAMGAMALFGEKYGDTVRVIKFGDSLELCGGIHTSRTGNIGLFKIISESAIAAGVRRIEATTGINAEKLIHDNEEIIASVKAMFNNTPNLIASVGKVIEENETLKRRVDEFMRERAADLKKQLLAEKHYINGINVLMLTGEYNPEVVKNVAFMLRGETSIMLIAGYSFEGKANLALMFSDDLVSHGRNAAKSIRDAAKLISGGGGGQPFFATAGGKEIQGLNAAISLLVETETK
ncbi:MAG: alanine--tRNA ligase [Bacteroidales bacterium]